MNIIQQYSFDKSTVLFSSRNDIYNLAIFKASENLEEGYEIINEKRININPNEINFFSINGEFNSYNLVYIANKKMKEDINRVVFESYNLSTKKLENIEVFPINKGIAIFDHSINDSYQISKISLKKDNEIIYKKRFSLVD